MNNVTAAVVLYNGERLIPTLAKTLSSLPADLKTVIYDSGSTDNSVAEVSRLLKNKTIIQGKNLGFGYGNNRCLEKIDTKYTLFLNSDASIDAESLELLISYLENNHEFAAVQPLIRLWDWDKVTASCGVFLTEYGEAWDGRFMHLEISPLKEPLQVPAITAAVALWRTDVLRVLNGFDEGFFMYFEDADLSLRAGAAGWKLAVVRNSEAFHMIGSSSKRNSAIQWELESSIRLFRRYLGGNGYSLNWWRRELRIFLYSISKGKSPFKRVFLVLRNLRKNVEIVPIPDEVKVMLFGDPMDFPQSRINKDSPGPGWKGNKISPWGGLKTDGKTIVFHLKAVDNFVSGSFLSGTGEILQRFCIAPGKLLKVKFAESPQVVYIHCDSSSDMLEVKLYEE